MIPQACVEYEMVDSQRGVYRAELAIMISYPTTVSRTIIIVLFNKKLPLSPGEGRYFL